MIIAFTVLALWIKFKHTAPILRSPFGIMEDREGSEKGNLRHSLRSNEQLKGIYAKKEIGESST